ncbi:MAG: hypothetical protein MZV64_02170 [Ignavibacteriales bacterium]|nr:hypothetical protein [Ignavibacteriales bacterium]
MGNQRCDARFAKFRSQCRAPARVGPQGQASRDAIPGTHGNILRRRARARRFSMARSERRSPSQRRPGCHH